jgi:cytochrome c-type biogenesis protein CcmE
MNKKQKNKLLIIFCILFILSIAAGLILYALKQNINLFYTPTQLLQAHIQPNQSCRVGGYVKNHSVQYDKTGTQISFVIYDQSNEITVNYHGVLPNLFREGQSVVVTGKKIGQQTLLADQVLAKHDEKYMPWPLKPLTKDKR